MFAHPLLNTLRGETNISFAIFQTFNHVDRKHNIIPIHTASAKGGPASGWGCSTVELPRNYPIISILTGLSINNIP